MPNITKRKALLASAALVVVAGAAVFAVHSGDGASAGVPAAPEQAVPVGVSILKEQPVRIWSGFSGRLRAVDFAEIRPEVSGRILEVAFRDGQIVTAGDVLFVVDPATYQAAVAKAEANLASATTNAAFAKTELERAGTLIKTGAISKSLYDGRVNAERVAQAAVGVAAAELRQARIDLDHATVRAPIAGRVSRAEITVGNLVQTGPAAPVLTSIASTRGIYADFEIDEQTYLRDIRDQSRPGAIAPGAISVDLTVRGDEGHVYHGQVQSFDNRIDTGSGTIRTRALFANEDGVLMPGMTVMLQVAGGGERGALLVPQAAVGVDQNKKFVFVVGADSKVAYREIQLGKQIGDKRVVLSGLAVGERVIVDGIQHVRPATLVDAREVGDGPSTQASRL
ncbi:MAG: efflux RND transporter periplasmic adaptor subunit [Rhodospirillaceae bacterium]